MLTTTTSSGIFKVDATQVSSITDHDLLDDRGHEVTLRYGSGGSDNLFFGSEYEKEEFIRVLEGQIDMIRAFGKNSS